MLTKVLTGLDRLKEEPNLREKYSGKIAYLCHQASVTKNHENGLEVMAKLFPEQLIKIFGPQHGFMCDLQENMIETDHGTHPVYHLPVYSLYSEVRKPTAQMLEGVDHFILDLQDIGTRIYTYIYTLYYAMEACSELGVELTVLDRPNPLGGIKIEGNMLEKDYTSFVGLIPMPLTHAMTMAEMAKYYKDLYFPNCKLEIIPMKGWKRELYFDQLDLPWIPPSPNIPMVESCFTFPATVIFEGTNLSEARGTTRPLEIVGHPKLEPISFIQHFNEKYREQLKGIHLRATYFQPTHHKFAQQTCGGVHIHITNREQAQTWLLGHLLCFELKQVLGEDFSWREPPYEYEYKLAPIDIINGCSWIRELIDSGNLSLCELLEREKMNHHAFLEKRLKSLLY